MLFMQSRVISAVQRLLHVGLLYARVVRGRPEHWCSVCALSTMPMSEEGQRRRGNTENGRDIVPIKRERRWQCKWTDEDGEDEWIILKKGAYIVQWEWDNEEPSGRPKGEKSAKLVRWWKHLLSCKHKLATKPLLADQQFTIGWEKLNLPTINFKKINDEMDQLEAWWCGMLAWWENYP